MIRFNSSSWIGTVFVFYGGVLPQLIAPTIAYVIYVSLLYRYCQEKSFGISADGIRLLAGFATFMLVFRLNQCHSRLQSALNMVAQCICSLRAIVALAVTTLKRRAEATEEERQAVTIMKVSVCRLAIAYIISLKYHFRVAEMMCEGSRRLNHQSMRHALSDLLRVKALLTNAEASIVEASAGLYEEELDTAEDDTVSEGSGSLPLPAKSRPGSASPLCGACSEPERFKFVVDFNRFQVGRSSHGAPRVPIADISGNGISEDAGACALPPIIALFLRLAVHEPNGKKWGYSEIVLRTFENHIGLIMSSFQNMSGAVGQPMPLPYCQLCKLLLLVFILAFPMSIEVEHGVWGNVIIPTLLAMTMIGFETVADTLENPLGDEFSDISLYEIIHEFEVEVQTIFDAGSAQRQDILQSMHELAAAHGLQQGCALLTQPSKLPDKDRFVRYFEWAELPRHTMDYISEQSTDSASLNSLLCRRFSARFCRMCGLCPRAATGLEAGAPASAISHCVALRAALPHLESSRKQQEVLAGADLSAPRSLRAAMR